MWIYGLQLWPVIKNQILTKRITSKIISFIKSPIHYMRYLNPNITNRSKTVHKEAVISYKIFHSRFPSYINSFISNLATLKISGDLLRRLKRN